jgi:7-cyano-7-deazaguanine synthase in queuosine biosynthesis
MATDRLVLCGGARLTAHRPPWQGATPLRLSIGRGRRDVHLNLYHLTRRLVAGLPAEVTDLLEIAAYVYAADQAVTRGGPREFEYGDRWVRNFRFEIPVRRLDLWTDPEVDALLRDTLGFLTDDAYEFGFVRHPNPPPADRYVFDGIDPDPTGEGTCEEVLLFSGGLDSLGGAVQEALKGRRKVALVSHRPTGKVYRRQAALCAAITARVATPALRPKFVAVAVNKGKRLGRNFSQRSRSFLFAAIAAAVARVSELDRIRFFENGVTSLNLPLSAQVVGGRASRTTHPCSLAGFEALFTRVLGLPFRVDNPFQWTTKAEVLAGIKAAGHSDLCAAAVSCGHTWAATTRHPHCGACTQCLDRRLSALAAGLTDAEDDPAGYAVDVLTGPRAGPDLTLVERFVGTAREISRLVDATAFVAKYPELVRAIRHTGLPGHEAVGRAFDLYRRHANGVLAALEKAVGGALGVVVRGDYPPTSLLGVACRPGSNGSVPGPGLAATGADDGRVKADDSRPALRVVDDEFAVRCGLRECFLGNTKEFDLVRLLAKRLGRYFSHQDLLKAVWPDTVVEIGTLYKTAGNARRRLADNGITEFTIDGSQKGHYALLVDHAPDVSAHSAPPPTGPQV